MKIALYTGLKPLSRLTTEKDLETENEEVEESEDTDHENEEVEKNEDSDQEKIFRKSFLLIIVVILFNIDELTKILIPQNLE